MTRKDYRLLAGVLNNFITSEYAFGEGRQSSIVTSVAKALAYHLEAENPRFDRAKFLKACGVE